jgi:hypothetical protein
MIVSIKNVLVLALLTQACSSASSSSGSAAVARVDAGARGEASAADAAAADGGEASEDAGGSSAAGRSRAGDRAGASTGKPSSAADAGSRSAADGGDTATTSERSREVPAPDEMIVPPETADVEALSALGDWSSIPVFGSGRYEQQSSHDRGQPHPDQDTVFPLFGNGNRDLDQYICHSADAQLGTTGVLPYLFDRDGCEDDYVHGVVLARYAGSGVLRRFWLTSSSLGLGSGVLADEVLRVYVDDNPRPLIQTRLDQVLSGGAGAIFAPPFGAASRYFIAWYYPVVFASKLVIVLDRLSADYYFQTDVVLDAEPKARVAPAARLPERDRALSLLTAATPVPPEAEALASEHVMLASSEQHDVMLRGPATIEQVELRVPRARLSDLAGVNVSVRWDGAGDAALDMPLLDLFAASRSVVAKSDLALDATMDGDDQRLMLRLPMPFRKSAKWTLENTAGVSAGFQLDFAGERRVPDGDFGHLHVQRDEVPIPAKELVQTFARASSRGRYVGLCADLAGHADAAFGISSSPMNFLEGDVGAMVDGRVALDGTGTEDYPDNSFYFLDTPRATPFAQNWNVINDSDQHPPGQASFCRWQVLGNEVDFQAMLQATFEIALHDPSIVDLHRTIAFLYLP